MIQIMPPPKEYMNYQRQEIKTQTATVVVFE